MNIEIRDLDIPALENLPPACRACLFWEAPEKHGKDEADRPKIPEEEARALKRDWFARVSGTFGNCAKTLHVDDKAIGYARYSPPSLLEKVKEYSRKLFPPGPDGVLLSCLHIQPDYRERGLGTRLLRAVIEDLRVRGCRAIETYSRDDSTGGTGPTVLYLENGFKVISTGKWGNNSFSLVRLELGDQQ